MTNFKVRERCPACGTAKTIERVRLAYDDDPLRTYLKTFYGPQGGVEFEYLRDVMYILQECPECGLFYQRNIPNDALMWRLYEVWIDPQIAFNQRPERSRRVNQHYISELMLVDDYFNRSPSDIEILDFGMGWGDWAAMANGLGFICHGLELSQSRIDYATKRGVNVLNWNQARQKRFDFINTEQVFEHIADPLDTLSNLKKLLKPGGIIKISVPTATNIEKSLSAMDWGAGRNSPISLNPVAPLEHIQYFHRRTLQIMASRVGMREFTWPMLSYWRSSCGSLSPFHLVKGVFKPIVYRLRRKQNYILLVCDANDVTPHPQHPN